MSLRWHCILGWFCVLLAQAQLAQRDWHSNPVQAYLSVLLVGISGYLIAWHGTQLLRETDHE